jgi:hypothetical protein
MSISLNRHYDSVWKKRVRGYFGYWDKSQKQLGQISRTRTPCSCAMCGNIRKHFNEITIQEKKALLDFQDQLKEIDVPLI